MCQSLLARPRYAGPLAEGVIGEEALDSATAAAAGKASEQAWNQSFGGSSDGTTEHVSFEGMSPRKTEPAACAPLNSAILQTERSLAAPTDLLLGDVEREISPAPLGDAVTGAATAAIHRPSLTSTEASSEDLELPDVEPKNFMVSSNSLFEDEEHAREHRQHFGQPGLASVRAPACQLLSLDEEDHLSDGGDGK